MPTVVAATGEILLTREEGRKREREGGRMWNRKRRRGGGRGRASCVRRGTRIRSLALLSSSTGQEGGEGGEKRRFSPPILDFSFSQDRREEGPREKRETSLYHPSHSCWLVA